jgi:hypothetical protein
VCGGRVKMTRFLADKGPNRRFNANGEKNFMLVSESNMMNPQAVVRDSEANVCGSKNIACVSKKNACGSENIVYTFKLNARDSELNAPDKARKRGFRFGTKDEAA